MDREPDATHVRTPFVGRSDKRTVSVFQRRTIAIGEEVKETPPQKITAALVIHAIEIAGKAPALLEAMISLAPYYERCPSDCANVINAIKVFIGESGVANNEDKKVRSTAPTQPKTRR